jgi:hypothetical protein
MNQHQQGRHQQRQLNQQQKTRLEQKPEKKAPNPANLQDDSQYQEHEHPESRLTR